MHSLARPALRWRAGSSGVHQSRVLRPHAATPNPREPSPKPPSALSGSPDQPLPATSATTDRRKLWMMAIKPPMYSVGFMPVLVSAAAMFAEHGVAPWSRCLGLVLGSIFVIAWLNLSNDAFDAETGVDRTKAESVVNLTGNRSLVLALAIACFAAGVGLLARYIAAAQDPRVAWMLGAAIACGYMYQGPQFRLSYRGLGEPLCFAAFTIATLAFYLAQQPAQLQAAASAAGKAAAAAGLQQTQLSPLIQLLAALQGVTITAILFCSHFHQIEGDKAAGKLSPLVRLGTQRGCQLLSAATAIPYALAAAAALAGVLPPPVLAAMALSLPAAAQLLRFAWSNHTVPAAIAPLKKFAVKWHMALGSACCLGLLLVGSRLGAPPPLLPA